MHMAHDAAEASILELEPEQQAREVWRRLTPERWPVSPKDLPAGSALVGGSIRDALIGRQRRAPDLDLVVPEGALKLTQRLARDYGGACVVLDEARDMARLVLGGWTLDLARRDGDDLETDLGRRDFRLNAIALVLGDAPMLLDPTDGIADLRCSRLQAVQEQNLIDDPLRLLRALRLIAELPLTIEAETRVMLHRHRHRLPLAAPERIQAELTRLVESPGAALALQELKALDLLAPWQELPAPGFGGVLAGADPETTASCLTTQERDQALPLLRLTTCLSDQGLQALRFSRRQQQRCARLRQWLHRDDGKAFGSLPEAERLTLHRTLEDDLPALILTLPLPEREEWLQRWRNDDDPLFHPRPPVDGRTLQESLSIPQGPRLGELLQHLSLERAFGRLHHREEALEAARLWLSGRCG
jgi:tRNA nucleotidyltransferase (CCA-adding enzyme)